MTSDDPMTFQGGVSPVAEPSHAVFLSYASQDAEAAQKICAALRAGGIEVFLDQSELRGGDAWDQKIRHEIHDCALFIPIVSQHTQERLEGYFRHEWKLAIERTHHMAEQMPFLVPVVVDGTREREAFVPDAFRLVQWTHLPGGETLPAFVERIKRLLSPELSPMSAVSGATQAKRELLRARWRSKPVLLAIVVLFAALAYLLADKFWISKHFTPTPPPHSVAVLPFVNLSGDKEQEYFSDGLTEEVLDSLSRINELQVAARTSAFSFKGTNTDIGTIARKLNVGAVLEGSVRRSEHTIRITAQLINAVSGFHLWSKSYDRDLGDVLKLQTEIATSVASALRVTLLGDIAQKIEVGGTRNAAAFDAYLKASKAFQSVHDSAKDIPRAIAGYTEAIQLDPNFALAFAARSVALTGYSGNVATGAGAREGFNRAESDARSALALAPDSAEAHMALALVFEEGTLDFARTNNEYERAVALAPGNAQVLRFSGESAVDMGHFDVGIAALRRAVVLDPLAHASHAALGRALYAARRFGEASTAFAEAISLDPDYEVAYGNRGLALYALRDFDRARASCEIKPDDWLSQQCLAIIYDKLGRRADAEALLLKLKTALGDNGAYQYATIYAQWGSRAKALEWLETALRLRDSGLENLKTDPLLDPVRNELRFRAIERELKFPD